MKTKPNSRNYVKKAILSLLVPCCLLQIGCTAPSDEEGSVTPPPPVYFAENGRSDYTVVSAMGSDGYDMADKFRSCFAAATGIELEYRADVLAPAEEGGREIVIGSTDRDSLFGADVEGIVTDGYLLQMAGSRLLIYADTKAGYERAFAAFFREAMGIEDLAQLQTPAAAASLPQDFALRVESTYRIEQNKTRSGHSYRVEGGEIREDNRFIDFSGYPHNRRQQEVPAFYTVSYFSDFVFYYGNSPWTGDTLTVKRDLPFWAGDNPDPYFRLKNNENWCAWVTPTGYALGLYSPLADVLVAGRYLYNGSKSPANAATSYVAPLLSHQLEFCKPYTYSYYLTTGTVESVRSTFETIHRGK